jgi:flavodoxin
MAFSDAMSRRTVMAALAGVSLVKSGSASSAEAQGQHSVSKILVAYFSRTGNTRVVAGLIHRALRTDLFEILPVVPYPEDYLATVDLARDERDRGIEPPLKSKVPSITSYETVFLGFPIWGETTPPVIRSFLRSHDLSGKNLIPFVTHGGYGLGNSQTVLASHAPKAQLHRGFSLQGDQERQTMERVTGWLSEAKVGSA